MATAVLRAVKAFLLVAFALLFVYVAGYESSGLVSGCAALGGVASFALATR